MHRENTSRGIAALKGASVSAEHVEIGKVDGFYFDQKLCVARYISAEAESGLRILIPPMAVSEIDWEQKNVSLNVTRGQIEMSPGIAAETPISRQFEQRYFDYFNWVPYWVGNRLWGETDIPGDRSSKPSQKDEDGISIPYTDLKNAFEEIGYSIEGRDGELGTLSDLMIDERSWEIRWITVDTRSWWFGGNVLVNVRSIEGISWDDRLIRVDLTRDLMKASPELQLGEYLTAEQEELLVERHESLRKAA